ncbi:DUF3369 domain-containing protein [Rhodoferax aquaticus]|uniref:DUF3369 domain-containing protein n=1 Tax=Rhodoferax aquaticus TaxID=2527691 RepID=A0A515ERF0_9BURK|nr:DUF3369 domain-containing protein [Rhodoferax aquaticus]QDL55218.1 DUF3369 domain-containing protein [Rhodoferax aquaticus]
MSDDMVFSDEPLNSTKREGIVPWHVLVVDDEPAVHEVTKMVMADFEMDGRPLLFTHCYSAKEARSVLAKPNDIALILLDVVMETDVAGLDLAKHIRNELHNVNVRIVLRTGQPGQAPEEQVIRDYDINDYKEKTDLTRRKLITVFYAGLRAYRDLMRIEQARQGLRRSIECIGHICDSDNLHTFGSALLEQVNLLLNLNGEGLCASRVSAYTANAFNGKIRVLAATAGYSELLTGDGLHQLPADVQDTIHRVLSEKKSHHADQHYAGYFRTRAGSESIIYMVFPEAIKPEARELLEILSRNVASTYDALLLREDSEHAQRATISILGSAIELRSSESLPHWQRVGDLAALLATWTGASEQDVELIRVASSLHDAGKACVPDAILNKAVPLTPEEHEILKGHAMLGHTMLSRSKARVHALGAIIALEHHERWDGSGYPQGLKGENISLVARIAAIADTLDAMLTQRPYHAALPLKDALAHIYARSGSDFDPSLVTLLQTHASEISALLNN